MSTTTKRRYSSAWRLSDAGYLTHLLACYRGMLCSCVCFELAREVEMTRRAVKKALEDLCDVD